MGMDCESVDGMEILERNEKRASKKDGMGDTVLGYSGGKFSFTAGLSESLTSHFSHSQDVVNHIGIYEYVWFIANLLASATKY